MKILFFCLIFVKNQFFQKIQCNACNTLLKIEESYPSDQILKKWKFPNFEKLWGSCISVSKIRPMLKFWAIKIPNKKKFCHVMRVKDRNYSRYFFTLIHMKLKFTIGYPGVLTPPPPYTRNCRKTSYFQKLKISTHLPLEFWYRKILSI